MTVVDTNIVIAAFASWHEFHQLALRALGRRPRLPAQVALETYSVLTRLPAPHRAPARLVRDFLLANFEEPYLALPSEGYAQLISAMVDAGVTGGAAYDGLIGAVAREAGATLLTFDQRARQAYETLGVSVEDLA